MQCVRLRCCLHLEVMHRSVPKDWREEKGARSQPCGTREIAKESMRMLTGTAGTRAVERGTRLVASLDGWERALLERNDGGSPINRSLPETDENTMRTGRSES